MPVEAVVSVWFVDWKLLFQAAKSVASVSYAVHPRCNNCASMRKAVTFVVESGDEDCILVFQLGKRCPHERYFRRILTR